jgi:quinol monooxygenase YgiN
VLAVTRLRAPAGAGDVPVGSGGIDALLGAVLDLLAAQPGFLSGRVARALDDPAVLVLVTEWSGAGAYRRALSGYDVKVAFADLMAYVDNEPSAFEVVASR